MPAVAATKLAPVPTPPPAVSPVPGTASAEDAAAKARAAKAAPVHVLRLPDGAPLPAATPRGLRDGESPVMAADRICAELLKGTGPILLVVPGTLGTDFQTSMLSTARAALRLAGDAPISIASVPYPNGIGDIVTRALHIGTGAEKNVLSLILHRLRRFAGNRPILLTGESQGAWLIADTLRAEPELAARVSRVAMFAKPGFVPIPPTVGTAGAGAGGATGIVEWRHVDDIVPSLFGRIGSAVLGGYVDAIRGWMATGDFEYAPHHYDRYGPAAARWLLRGERPGVTVRHSSDPTAA